MTAHKEYVRNLFRIYEHMIMYWVRGVEKPVDIALHPMKELLGLRHIT